MGGPAWLSDAFAAVMLALAAYCAARLAIAAGRRRETELDTDIAHLVMGIAMAGMLVPRLAVVPGAGWTAVFAAVAAWFAWQSFRTWRGLSSGPWRCPYPVPHLAESLAMVYMLVAAGATAGAGSSGAMAGMSTAPVPELAVVFAVFLVGYIAWLGDRFTSLGTVTAGPETGAPAAGGEGRPAGTGSAGEKHPGGCWPALFPRGACCSKIVMSIVMAYMLIIML